MRRGLLAVAAAVLTLLTASAGLAQTGTGRISGLVKDATGALAPGVTVTALHEETGVRHETVTTDSGLFLFPSLPVGPYAVRAELNGGLAHDIWLGGQSRLLFRGVWEGV